jgi:hypothetical protein
VIPRAGARRVAEETPAAISVVALAPLDPRLVEAPLELLRSSSSTRTPTVVAGPALLVEGEAGDPTYAHHRVALRPHDARSEHDARRSRRPSSGIGPRRPLVEPWHAAPSL